MSELGPLQTHVRQIIVDSFKNSNKSTASFESLTSLHVSLGTRASSELNLATGAALAVDALARELDELKKRL